MPTSTDQYLARRQEADERAIGAAEKHRMRKARESGARSGTLYSGVQARREDSVMAETDEQLRQAALDREMERYNAYQRELDRAHQVAMQESQQTWQTGEREGSQSWQGGQSEAQRQWQTSERMDTQDYQNQYARLSTELQSSLQAQAEAVKMELQNALQNGQMDQLQYQTEMSALENRLNRTWQYEQNNLDRLLQQSMQQAGFGQEQLMGELGFGWQQELNQGQYGQEQWMAEFGAGHDINMANLANDFENYMMQTQHGYDLARQEWDAMMFGLDAQLQLDINGFDWNNDDYSGGQPLWFNEGWGAQGNVEAPNAGMQYNPDPYSYGTGYQYPTYQPWENPYGGGGY